MLSEDILSTPKTLLRVGKAGGVEIGRAEVRGDGGLVEAAKA